MALTHPDVDELLGAIRGCSGIDVARKGVELVLQALAEGEATERTGVARYERGEARRAQRNGYRGRLLATRPGTRRSGPQAAPG